MNATSLAAPKSAGWRGITLPIAVCLGVLYVIWGSTYLGIRYVVEALPALLASGARFLVGGFVLMTVLALRGSALPTRREWLASIPGGALLFMIGNGFVALSEKQVSSSAAAVIIGTMPLFATALAARMGEKTTRRQWLGLAIGFLGVLVMGAGDMRGTPGALLLLLVAAFGWALGTTLSRKLPVPSGMMAAATHMITGACSLLLAGFAVGERLPVLAEVPSSAWFALAYLMVFGSLVAFSAYMYLLRNAPASMATSYAYVNPLVAVVLGVGIGHERLGASTPVAAVLVVIGVAFIITGKAKTA